jgi:hypothetical protein
VDTVFADDESDDEESAMDDGLFVTFPKIEDQRTSTIRINRVFQKSLFLLTLSTTKMSGLKMSHTAMKSNAFLQPSNHKTDCVH